MGAMPRLSLKQLREMGGHTQDEMARICQVSKSSWRRWERNPDEIPHGVYEDIILVLEKAIQAKKEIKMSNVTKVGVRFVAPDEDDDEPDMEYTVPIPEGLTETFEPSKPVTEDQWSDWSLKRKEPYKGFAKELDDWRDAWDDVDRRQMEADGVYMPDVEPVEVDPDYADDGEPVDYTDEPRLTVDPSTGEVQSEEPEEVKLLPPDMPPIEFEDGTIV